MDSDFDECILVTPALVVIKDQQEEGQRMMNTLCPDSLMTPRTTKYDPSSSPPSVSRSKNKIDRSLFTDGDGQILNRFLLSPLDEAFDEIASPKSTYRLDLRQRKSYADSYEGTHSFSLSESPSESASRSKKFAYSRKLSLPIKGQGKMPRGMSGSALAA
jgi:hypothetical protein